jgi:hypothetical protein
VSSSQEVFKKLKKKGKIILIVPNFESLPSKIMKEKCPETDIETYFLSAGQNYLSASRKDPKNFEKISG